MPVHASSVGVPIGTPTILEPAAAAKLALDLSSGLPRVRVYRYLHPFTRWRLSIATHAEPGSLKLSLGGFRIAPEERTSSPGFDSDREELGGMMGYLTAVEEYLSRAEGVPFDVATILDAARALEPAAHDATRYAIEHDFAVSFEDAMPAVRG